MNVVRSQRHRRQAGKLALHVSRLLLWGVVTAGFSNIAHTVAAQGVEQDAEKVTRFQRTAQYLQGASPELRSDFAATALSGLASAYYEEAKMAREESRRSGRHASLRAWSATVDRFASQMPLLIEDIQLGLPVRLTLGAEKSLAITVADRTVILSHPRLNQQNAFEQSILVAFCTRHSCEKFLPGDGQVQPIPVSAAQVRPKWTFTSQESLCAYHGITVRFTSASDMANARLLCEQFLQEVVTLADELAWQQRHAVAIEWGQLAIQATPRRPEHMVQLNALGDSILVTVPVLYGSPGLLADVLPWIRQRVSDRQEVNIDLNAERYGWQRP
jgi:hypothetical protein